MTRELKPLKVETITDPKTRQGELFRAIMELEDMENSR